VYRVSLPTLRHSQQILTIEVAVPILIAAILTPIDIGIIVVVGVLLFGKRLPDLGRYLGKLMNRKERNDDDDDMAAGVITRV
jgi:hypothetical protein